MRNSARVLSWDSSYSASGFSMVNGWQGGRAASVVG